MTGDYMISVIPATTSRITVNFPVIQVIITAALAVIAVVSVCYALYVRRNTARTFERLNDMIDSASEGTFRASVFDESELSALENRFGNFLDSTLTSKAGMQEEKDRIKEMISDISHQTKTPIANLLLHSELLGEDESISPESRESLEIIHFQAEKLKFLVDSLVKLSRLENGIVSLNVSRNSLKELARSVVSELSGKAERKGLVLWFEAGPEEIGTEEPDKKPGREEDLTASFDPKWTYEALLNIVDNAIKYTDSGSVQIRISVSDMFARIDVTDTGIGIGEEDSAKVFQRFYRSTEVSAEEGVGIGLYLAREIITAEGGYIRLTSEKGKGSTFSIFLPTGQ